MYPEVTTDTLLFVCRMDVKLAHTGNFVRRFNLGLNTDANPECVAITMEMEVEEKPINTNDANLANALVVDIPDPDSEIRRAMIPPIKMSHATKAAGANQATQWLQHLKFSNYTVWSGYSQPQ